MAVGDIFQMDIVSSLNGQYAENVLNFEQYTTGASSDPLILASQLIAAYRATCETAYLSCLASDVLIIGYRARRISPLGGNTAFTPTPTLLGTVAGNSYASSAGACLLGQYQDAVTTKFRTGRTFMPSTPTAYIQRNALQSAYVTALTSLVTDLQTAMVSGAYTFYSGIWSRKRTRFYSANGNACLWTFSATVGTQRRRLHPAL